MKKTNKHEVIIFLVEISVLSALGLVLDFTCGFLSGWLWPQGGSVSLAMVTIFISSYRHGLKGGLLTGLLIGTIQLLWAGGAYLIHPVQIILDYPLPYTLLGLAGVFTNKVVNNHGFKQFLWVVISITIPCILRIASHTISGIYYWSVPFWGSIIYNGSFIAISMVLSIFITTLLLKNGFLFKQYDKENQIN